MNWFRRLMYGRYGSDQLNIFLLILSVAISIISIFVPVRLFNLLGFVPLGFAFFRMFSRNHAKRQTENFKFLRFITPIKNFFTGIPKRIREWRQYKHFSCPSCKQKVRVPRGKGKVRVTCPACKEKFVRKS